MLHRTHVLLAPYYNLGYSVGGSNSPQQPPNRVDWSMYDELIWTFTLHGISDGGTVGAPGNTLPTAFALKAAFEFREQHAGTAFRFQTPAWHKMMEDDLSKVVEGKPLHGPGQESTVTIDPITGVGAGTIATQATTGYSGVTGLFTNPIRVTRTLRHFPSGVRVNLAGTSFTGGTDPRFLLSIEVEGKGN